MAVAFDAATEATWTTTPDPFTFNHTPSGTPRGVALFVQQLGNSADQLDGAVTYGGVAMTRVPTNGIAQDTTGEPCADYCYFLGSGIPTGTQTVSIAHTAGAGTKHAVCMTLTAGGDTSVAASNRLQGDQANPSISLDSGSDVAIRLAGFASGGSAGSATVEGDCTAVHTHSITGSSCYTLRETTPVSGTNAVGWTAANNDVAMIAIAIKEAVASLVVQDATHAQSAENLALTQVHVLSVADAGHAQTADQLALTQVHELAVQDATHAHSADTLALVVDLVIQDAVHVHTADNLALTQVHVLVVQDASHGQTADNLALTQVHELAIADAAHGQTADNVVLVLGDINLAIQDGTHAHAADGLALTQLHELVVQEAAHAQVADSLGLTQIHELAVQDGVHAHLGDSLGLTQVHELVLADAVHAHLADNVVLEYGGVGLLIADSLHAHTAESLLLIPSEVAALGGVVRFGRSRGIGRR